MIGALLPSVRYLRLSHLDELPELINVIRGEMSLIGPRPERPELIAQLERVFRTITCATKFAQVSRAWLRCCQRPTATLKA